MERTKTTVLNLLQCKKHKLYLKRNWHPITDWHHPSLARNKETSSFYNNFCLCGTYQNNNAQISLYAKNIAQLFCFRISKSTTREDVIFYRFIVGDGGRYQDDPVQSCAWTQIFYIFVTYSTSFYPTLLFSLKKLRFSSSFLCLWNVPKQL